MRPALAAANMLPGHHGAPTCLGLDRTALEASGMGCSSFLFRDIGTNLYHLCADGGPDVCLRGETAFECHHRELDTPIPDFVPHVTPQEGSYLVPPPPPSQHHIIHNQPHRFPRHPPHSPASPPPPSPPPRRSEFGVCADDYDNCLTSRCCASAGFACFKRRDRQYAQCRPRERVSANCSLLQQMHDAEEIFAPVAMAAQMASLASGAPPSAVAAALSLLSLDPRWMCEVEWVGCEASPFDRCEDSRCCSHEGYGCYKRPRVDYGQCRPLTEAGCVDSDEWRCPNTWESCQTEPYGECTDTRCCSHPGFACFKRPFADYAQCRPQRPEEAEACEDDAIWLCPGHWEHCGTQFGECSASRCCDDADFGCFRRANSAYAECRRRQPRGCVDDEEWLCPGTWKHCTAADGDCSATRCCAFGYGCARKVGTQVGVCKAIPPSKGSAWEEQHGHQGAGEADDAQQPGQGASDDLAVAAAGSSSSSSEEEEEEEQEVEGGCGWAGCGFVGPSGWEYPACSHGFDECTSTRCCADAGFGCFMKRNGRDWAQCRPLSVLQQQQQQHVGGGSDGVGGVGGSAAATAAAVAAEAAEWLAPGEWEACAADYGACAGPLCCTSPLFGCYRSASDPSYAQCRPVPPEKEVCEDTGAWLCPGWERCSAPLGSCLSSMCCQQPQLFTCYARDAGHGDSHGGGGDGSAPLHASCLRTGTCEHEWGPGASCAVHQPSPPAQPLVPPGTDGYGGGGGGHRNAGGEGGGSGAGLDYAQARLAQDGYAASSTQIVMAVVVTTAAVCGVALCAALSMLWRHLQRREASYGSLGQPAELHAGTTATRRAGGAMASRRMLPVGARAAIGPHAAPDADDTTMAGGEEAAAPQHKPEWDGALSTVQVVRVERRGAAAAAGGVEADGTELVAARGENESGL